MDEYQLSVLEEGLVAMHATLLKELRRADNMDYMLRRLRLTMREIHESQIDMVRMAELRGVAV